MNERSLLFGTTAAAPAAPVDEAPSPEQIFSARVLVVDDSKMMRMGIIRSLKQLGFQNITEAADGRAAIERIKAEAFDLMLLDVEMPEMTGMEVLAAMRADAAINWLPVIVISGGEDIANAVKCIELGAEDYLPKPFSPVLLRARATTSIEKKKLRDLDKLRMQQLRSQHELVLAEQEKTERLLANILPKFISDRLKLGEELIADSHDGVSVLFADLVAFTKLSRTTSAPDLVSFLNEMMSAFDLITERSGLEKIKTIGDNFMLVGGVPQARADHAQAVADVGLEMLESVQALNRAQGTNFEIRVGINSGPIVAGVIGIRKFTYDVWGDTVNIASRMESSGVGGRVRISASTADLLRAEFDLEDGEVIEVKSIGPTQTYFVLGRKSAAARK